MLSKPRFGWCLVSISTWKDRGSYLDDIPLKLLLACQTVLLEHRPFAVLFDAEGYEYTIEFRPEEVEITTYTIEDEIITRVFDIPVYYLASELIRDIRRDLEDWVFWPPYSESPGFDADARRTQLLNLCDIVEELLPKNFS